MFKRIAFVILLLLSSPAWAWHDTSGAFRVGLDNEVGAYLHKMTNAGPLFASIVVVCHGQRDCDPADQTAMVSFYRTAEARNQDVKTEAEGYLGTGVFGVQQDGETVKKLIFYVYPGGRRWDRPTGTPL